ncbi:MAG: hypothetical protein RDV41_10955, partial [Planctomycetota bacterium]|nr:hypothetical protein [Planctomycetota bacterium]
IRPIREIRVSLVTNSRRTVDSETIMKDSLDSHEKIAAETTEPAETARTVVICRFGGFRGFGG